MAEDDLNESAKEVTEETVAGKETPPTKKKAVRKKPPQAKTTAKKKVSVKKKAAPKKKAARKSGSAASAEKKTPTPSPATAPQTPPPPAVPERETTSAAVAAVASTAPSAVTAASTAANTSDQKPVKPTESVAGPSASPPKSGEQPPKETPTRNEGVQKRLEEMGLMPPDSAEKQTPPPTKKSATGLGFWQKSFIWTIVIVAGLLYIRTITNNDAGTDDQTAMGDGDGIKTEQVASTDSTAPDAAASGNPETAVDQPNAPDAVPLAATAESANNPTVTTDHTGSAPADGAAGDSSAAMMTGTSSAESVVPGGLANQPAEEAAANSAQEPDAIAGAQQAAGAIESSPAQVAQSVASEASQASAGQGSEQPPLSQGGSISSETAPQAEETAVVAEQGDAEVTESTDSQTAKQAEETAVIAGDSMPAGPGPAGSENQAAPTPMASPMDIPSRLSGMASRYAHPGMAPMWSNSQPPQSSRPGTTQSSQSLATADPAPGGEQDQAGKPAAGAQQPPAVTGPRYPQAYPRGFLAPGYPGGYNYPQVGPYYWPYPPRPPVYGPPVRYPYHYPQVPGQR